MRFKVEEDRTSTFQMAPMIDVVFQLLIFFMVATSYKQDEMELRVKLPSPGPAQQVKLGSIQVKIERDGNIIVNEVSFDKPTSRELPQLREHFRLSLELDRTVPVILIPDPETPYQRVVDVLNACQGTGVENISFHGTAGDGG